MKFLATLLLICTSFSTLAHFRHHNHSHSIHNRTVRPLNRSLRRQMLREQNRRAVREGRVYHYERNQYGFGDYIHDSYIHNRPGFCYYTREVPVYETTQVCNLQPKLVIGCNSYNCGVGLSSSRVCAWPVSRYKTITVTRRCGL